MAHLGGDQLAGQLGCIRVAFRLGQMAFQHGIRGALSEICFEHSRQGQPATGPPAADAVSPRRHRPGR